MSPDVPFTVLLEGDLKRPFFLVSHDISLSLLLLLTVEIE